MTQEKFSMHRNQTDILLLHPPATKPSEPPLSLAVLLSYLKNCNYQVEALDANLAAYRYLLDNERLENQAVAVGRDSETSIRRALKHRASSLELLTSGGNKLNFPRYNTAVRYLNTLLSLWQGEGNSERLTLGDYQKEEFSSFSPDDLQRMAVGESPTIFAEYFTRELLPEIEAISPRYISLTINYIHQVLPAFELAGMLKQLLPDSIIVAGGGLITSWQTPIVDKQLRLPIFNHLIFGPGEAALAALIAGNTLHDYILKDSSAISFVPDYSFSTIEDYLSPEQILAVTSSRGCYWKRCLFCPEAASPVHPYCGLKDTQLTELLLSLNKRHGVTIFHLTDNAIPVNELRKLATGGNDLHKEGIQWFGFVRFEQALEDFEFVEGLARSGCKMLQLGLESGSQRVLDLLGKGIDLDVVSKVLENLHRAGIATYVYIMLGTPGEQPEDAQMTLAYLEAHAEQINYLNISIMNLPIESGILADPQLYGIDQSIPIDDESPLSLYRQFDSISGWGRTEARRFLKKDLLGSAVIKEIVNRTPPLFTSNHALFFRQ